MHKRTWIWYVPRIYLSYARSSFTSYIFMTPKLFILYNYELSL